MDSIRDTREKVFVMNDEYLSNYARRCGIYATGVYMSLCRHADKKQSCFPSKKLIGEELAISEREVYKSLKILEEWGIIKIENQGRMVGGHFRNNVYVLLDKSMWFSSPQAPRADGISEQSPQAYQSSHRRHTVPNKDTHKEKDTHIKEEEENSTAKAVSPQAAIIESWGLIYKSQTGEEYKADKRDFVIMANLIKKYGSDVVAAKSRRLFDLCRDRSVWFTKGGMADFTVGKLSSRWNEIIKGADDGRSGISQTELEDFLSKRE